MRLEKLPFIADHYYHYNSFPKVLNFRKAVVVVVAAAAAAITYPPAP
jgi:hypothetical protein